MSIEELLRWRQRGLSLSAVTALQLLAERELYVSELAERMEVAQGVAAALVGRLEEGGLLERQHVVAPSDNPGPPKRTLLKLTPLGRRILE